MAKAKGLRTVKLGSMELFWGILQTEKFEAEAREYLLEKKAIKEGNLPGAFEMLNRFVDYDTAFRLLALEHCTGLSKDEIATAIDENGIPKIDINRALLESMAIAEGPLLLASLKENWQLSDELRERTRKAETVKQIEDAMKELQKKLKRLGVLEQSSLNSDSGQTKPKDSP